MNKSTSIEDKLKTLTQQDRIWYYQYLDLLKSQKKSEDTILSYKNDVISYMGLQPNINANLIPFNLIAQYLSENVKPNRILIRYYGIKLFLEMISKDNPLNFNIEDFYKLKPIREDVINSTRKRAPLTIEEIIKIRSILKNDFRRLFTFEIIYLYGLKLEELVQIAPEKFDKVTGYLKLNKKKSFLLPERIVKLLPEPEKVLNRKNRSTYFDIIREISEKISIVLTWGDIIETREQNFFNCPICKTKFENTPEYWALIEYEGVDNSTWIVCKECAIKGEKL